MLNSIYRPIAKSFIEGLTSLPDKELEAFLNEISSKEYEAGSLFTKIGDMHDRVGLVVKGVFRVYYISSDGELHIRNFCREGMLLGSYGTILTGVAAHVNVEAIESSVVLEFPFEFVSSRYDKHVGWERLGRKVAESHYISREKREHCLLSLDATERLESFRKDFPDLEQRITKANVASYIGVTPETLSRMMRKQRP